MSRPRYWERKDSAVPSDDDNLKKLFNVNKRTLAREADRMDRERWNSDMLARFISLSGMLYGQDERHQPDDPYYHRSVELLMYALVSQADALSEIAVTLSEEKNLSPKMKKQQAKFASAIRFGCITSLVLAWFCQISAVSGDLKAKLSKAAIRRKLVAALEAHFSDTTTDDDTIDISPAIRAVLKQL